MEMTEKHNYQEKNLVFQLTTDTKSPGIGTPSCAFTQIIAIICILTTTQFRRG